MQTYPISTSLNEKRYNTQAKSCRSAESSERGLEGAGEVLSGAHGEHTGEQASAEYKRATEQKESKIQEVAKLAEQIRSANEAAWKDMVTASQKVATNFIVGRATYWAARKQRHSSGFTDAAIRHS